MRAKARPSVPVAPLMTIGWGDGFVGHAARGFIRCDGRTGLQNQRSPRLHQPGSLITGWLGTSPEASCRTMAPIAVSRGAEPRISKAPGS
jgi:hypothetical protein